MVTGRPFRVLLASGVAVFALAGCGTADAEGAPVERKAFAFGGDALVVDSDNSELVITPADIDEVRVERQVDGWVFMGSGPEASWKLVDRRLTLRVECDAVASSCGAVHRIQVPRGVAVSVEDDNGGVTADGFSTPLKVRSDNGDVRVRNASGALDLGSGNGDVDVEDSVTSARLSVRSDNGDVGISLRTVPRKVDVVTDNGDVTVTVPRAEYAVSGSSDNGDVRLDVPRRDDSEHVVSLRSDNGDLAVRTVN
ncbi:DUF4097 family beta strand repeat-containing protein [Streptomyces sp. SP18ES09]|uniref:DUF4097 family beta strand repeat-containing protein n=1 Tax=Streptomyces sp. SP18ES09 TaxID=3002532 RepID=UPI002E780C1D|nr:DUF4097 family beta strand repeat-containing protein [Streptomyces sp. SP18ES09]MEE1818291.1 DUF4097 family beta strand repeat-containing protein [Streptomyces sp. SP18ES09]